MAPTSSVLNPFTNAYSGLGHEHGLPALSTSFAVILAIIYTLTYVLPFYLSPTTRPSPALSRDAPSVIRARIRAVSLSCLICATTTLLVLLAWASLSPLEAVRLLGWFPISPTDITKTATLTALLFAGPLFERGVVEGEWRNWIRGARVAETLGSWIGWRNFVAGPITEELLFRSLLTPLALLSHHGPAAAATVTLTTPLYFGIAHVHHFYEYTLTHPHTPLLPALLRSLVQFAYTSLFGFYATFVFLRTGSLPAAILAHAFCNWCGLPRLWGRVEPGVPIGPPDIGSRRKRDGEDVRGAVGAVGQFRVGPPAGGETDEGEDIAWTVAYYIILVGGAAAFYECLWALTESGNALVAFGPPALTGGGGGGLASPDSGA
ncbi:MAG: hypothetical protein M1819_007406 [Sarea resinae]|nr:MAG: hypothetical protein M1819_007406 [Sarea resinae]